MLISNIFLNKYLQGLWYLYVVWGSTEQPLGLCYDPDRAIFVQPLNENAQTKQKQQTNKNRAILLVYRTDTKTHGFCLVKQILS